MLMLDELWEYEDVIKDLNVCLMHNANSNGFNNLGLAHFEIGEIEKAFNSFSLAIKTDELNTIAYINRAELNTKWKKKDYAESDYGTAIKLDSSNVSNWICRAHFYKENNELEKALYDFKKANRLESNFKPVKEQISEIEKSLGIKPRNWFQKLTGI